LHKKRCNIFNRQINTALVVDVLFKRDEDYAMNIIKVTVT